MCFTRMKVEILFSNNQQMTATGAMWYCQDSHNTYTEFHFNSTTRAKDNKKERVTFGNSKYKSLCTIWIMCFKPSTYFQPKVKKPAFPVFSQILLQEASCEQQLVWFFLELNEIQIESANIELVYIFSLGDCRYN